MHDLKFLHFSLQLGCHLAMMCNGTIQSDLLQRITSLRKAMARDLGIFIPEMRIRDNLDLKSGEYLLMANYLEIARGEVYPDYLAAFCPGNMGIQFLPTRPDVTPIDPTSNQLFVLVRTECRELLEDQGILVVDAIDLLISHLSRAFLRFAYTSTAYSHKLVNG